VILLYAALVFMGILFGLEWLYERFK